MLMNKHLQVNVFHHLIYGSCLTNLFIFANCANEHDYSDTWLKDGRISFIKLRIM